ncbi:MAG: leucyl/phenylalanyl-tRNA--protein transferase [Gemmataceae bacterium]|nr:leucyl/phenylalanyl-tRNA--protein transferase [Gemmataceae bacterium]
MVLGPADPEYWDPFHPPLEDDPFGAVGTSGDLSPDFLWEAYRRGIFPMPDDEESMVWMCPNPRAILRFENLVRHKRLLRRMKSLKLTYSLGADFNGVMRACGENRPEGTWITPRMLEAYHWLHRLGQAQSLEVWSNGQMVGGVYGVVVGSIFCAESMFSRITDGSKAALVFLCDHLKERNFRFVDCQFLNPHTQSLGAEEISREVYLAELEIAKEESPEWKAGTFS